MRIESNKHVQIKIEPPPVKPEEKTATQNTMTRAGSSPQDYLTVNGYDNSGVVRRGLENQIPLSAPVNEPPPMTEPVVSTETIETSVVAGSVIVVEPLIPDAQGLEFTVTKGASELAYWANKGEVYQFSDGSEWQVAEVHEDPATGFRAIALKPLDPNDDRTVLAFAGTDPNDPNDLLADFEQWEGKVIPEQYMQAAALAEKYNSECGNLILTGHSLGGGLAAFASLENGGIPATTINPSTINGISIAVALFPNPGLVSNITNYVTPMDPISRLPLGVTLGSDIAVEGGYESPNPFAEAIEDHKTPNVAPDVPFPVRIS